jgi:hypothetical protein
MSLPVVEIIFVVVLLAVIRTLFTYSKEGDILTLLNGAPGMEKLKQEYKTRESIVKRLHDLLLYKESYVRWNRQAILSVFVALIVIYLLQGEIKLAPLVLTTCLIFFAIDLPNRWGHTHISAGVIHEGTQLYSLFHLVQ